MHRHIQPGTGLYISRIRPQQYLSLRKLTATDLTKVVLSEQSEALISRFELPRERDRMG
jgi:hypothetical protein